MLYKNIRKHTVNLPVKSCCQNVVVGHWSSPQCTESVSTHTHCLVNPAHASSDSRATKPILSTERIIKSSWYYNKRLRQNFRVIYTKFLQFYEQIHKCVQLQKSTLMILWFFVIVFNTDDQLQTNLFLQQYWPCLLLHTCQHWQAHCT